MAATCLEEIFRDFAEAARRGGRRVGSTEYISPMLELASGKRSLLKKQIF